MKLYKIYYDSDSKRTIDSKFIPLNNSNPSEPSWYEFEPIKKVLENENFNDEEYVGFFSPRLFEKTGLTAADVIKVVEKSKSEVISFSSDIEAGMSYINCFIMANQKHPGSLALAQKTYRNVGINLDLLKLVSCQQRTIYANYWVAKYSFWKVWFSYAIKIYYLASNKNNLLYKKLNQDTFHRGTSNGYQFKIFIMERLINALLEFEEIDAEIGINYDKYFFFRNRKKVFINALYLLNDYKTLFLKTRDKKYLDLFNNIIIQTYK